MLPEIVRQHAEMAAFLWTVYDWHMAHPGENPDMDEERLARLVERLEAHLDGLRVAGEEGRRIAAERYAEYPEAGEAFVVRMLQRGRSSVRVCDLEIDKVRRFLAEALAKQANDFRLG